MKEVLDFLNQAGVYYLATVEGDQPRVRPIGFVMEYDGKLMFSTSNQKAMYRQLIANPKVEIACYDGAGKTLRISGKAVFATSDATQAQALELMPMLKNMYSVGDGLLEIYYLEEAKAICVDMSGNSQEWTI